MEATPTERDLENASIREEIAEKQEAEYRECYLLALDAFGPGWTPSGRHSLHDKADEDLARRTGGRAKAAATVFTVKHKDGRKRHFTLIDGRVRECAGYQEGFGEMLDERHPTMRIEIRGEKVAPHRFSLCWAGYELYAPKTAEQLAALRVSRERGKAERELKEWKEANPLFADQADAEKPVSQETGVSELG